VSRANEPAYPATEHNLNLGGQVNGLTIREHFAGLLGGDAEEIAYSTLSLDARASLVGRPRPTRPRHTPERGSLYDAEVMEYQIAAFRWELDVRAVMRCMAADALIAELDRTK
jgi:hypothetical protein